MTTNEPKVARITGIISLELDGCWYTDKIDNRYFRPTEVETLLGDPTKVKQKLGWVPEITAQDMCKEMVAHDLALARQHALLKANGCEVNVGVE